MRALSILTSALESVQNIIHRRRFEAVMAAVGALIMRGRLSLTSLGRGINSGTIARYNIKRIDRLLGNEHLHSELGDFYRGICAVLVDRGSRPIVLVDWTTIGYKQDLLLAALALDGRAVPIYGEIVGRKKHNTRWVHKRFLKNLARVLPRDCTPIIVTDAGFRTPWLREVQKHGWDFVARLGEKLSLTPLDQSTAWRRLSTLYRRARVERAIDLGLWKMNKSSPLEVMLVAYKKKLRRKSNKPRTRPVRPGESRSSTKSKKNRRRAHEPWILATSLTHETAKRVVGIYIRRMQIEETIRDTKSHRFGWSFEDARSRNTKRLEVLVLIGALASLATVLAGIAAERCGMHHDYQANSVRTKRVLSLTFLGRQVLLSGNTRVFSSRQIADAWTELRLKTTEVPCV